MERLGLGSFHNMMFALKHPGHGSTEMPMEMAVGVGRPFRDELD
jgi:hypothetical protein